MARNTQLESAPIFDEIIDSQNKITEPWTKWLNRIKFYLSNDSHQLITGPTSINLDAKYVKLSNTSGGTFAITLDAPSLEGKFMMIEMIEGSGVNTVTLSLVNCTGGTASTTCTWNNSNQQLLLQSANSKWVIYKQNNVTVT